MKSRYIALLTLLVSHQAFAASGIFGTGVVLNVNGTKNLYTTTLLGDSKHIPINVTAPTLVSSFPANLGTFNTSLSQTLTLMGGEMLTYKSGSDNITGANILYRINGGTFNTVPLIFNENNVSGASGDQRWYAEGAGVNLTGLGNGTYTLDVYYTAPFTWDSGSGTHTVNNGGTNYSTTFTVVPEPSAALLGGLGALALLRRRRA